MLSHSTQRNSRKEACHRKRCCQRPRNSAPPGLHRRRQPHAVHPRARAAGAVHARRSRRRLRAAAAVAPAVCPRRLRRGHPRLRQRPCRRGQSPALRLGMGEAMTAFTVQINCGSGMQSIDTAYQYIREGKSDLILAGGTDALSWSPLLFRKRAVDWYARLFGARDVWHRIEALGEFRPSFLKPVVGLERGLTDPVVELTLGPAAEIAGHLFHVSRHDADAYAAESQQRLARAQKDGVFAGELEVAFSRDGRLYDHDDGVRPDSTVETLAKLKPAFERPWGKVTAGNSSQITDGASWVILASEAAMKKHGLTPRAVIVDSEWSALDPSIMGLGPVLCATAILRRHSFSLADIGLWELNEAFAAQVLACLAAWEDDTFCREVLGLERAA